MPTFPHHEFDHPTGRTAARKVACMMAGRDAEEGVAPVAFALVDDKDASRGIEKDGTGIGTGPDKGRQPALGTWSGLAQDVLMEHGRSRTLAALPLAGRVASPHRWIC